MKVLVIGSGGREHALVWKISQSPSVTEVYCAPGNPGIAGEAQLVPLQADNLPGLLGFAKDHQIDLTVVGPEQPLAMGIVDLFTENNLCIFGPTRRASQLEWSKSFAKEFMERHSIPTARYRTFRREDGASLDLHLRQSEYPLVLKADGLAAGKGVLICASLQEARKGVSDFFESNIVGSAGEVLVAEEFMRGPEASIFAITDGEDYVILAPAQDYKRVFDNDDGKNTGGMGAFAPAPVVTQAMMEEIRRTIIEPTLQGMMKEGTPYRGCLYAGLMITPEGPKVVEYNSRFGDPETQVVLPLFTGDFAQLLLASATSQISEWHEKHSLSLSDESAVCVILASGGYPDHYEKGKEIRGLDSLDGQDGLVVFHAGTSTEGGKTVSSGGRVLGVVAYGHGNLMSMRKQAYDGVSRLSFDGMHFRTDIGRPKSVSGSKVHG